MARQPIRRKTPAPENLPLGDKQWLCDQCQRRPELRRYATPQKIQHLVDRCLAHHGAKGTEFADWRRACWNWILKQQEIDSRPKPHYRPQERDPFAQPLDRPEALSDLLERMGVPTAKDH